MESSVTSSSKLESNQTETSVCQLEKMLAYGSFYSVTKLEGVRASINESISSLLKNISTVVLGMMVLFISIGFLIYGVSLGIGQALGKQAWLGFAITGGSLALGLSAYSFFKNFRIRSQSMQSQVKKYENEREKQRKKFGQDMVGNSEPNIGVYKSESEFLAWQAGVAKGAFLGAGHQLGQNVSDAFKVNRWIQKYPFYSAGVAAATGFMLTGTKKPSTFKQASGLKISLEKKVPQNKNRDHAFIKTALATTVGGVTEEIIRDTVIPYVKERLYSISQSLKSASQSSMSVHEKVVLKGQEKMDAEGGNQGESAASLNLH